MVLADVDGDQTDRIRLNEFLVPDHFIRDEPGVVAHESVLLGHFEDDLGQFRRAVKNDDARLVLAQIQKLVFDRFMRRSSGNADVVLDPPEGGVFRQLVEGFDEAVASVGVFDDERCIVPVVGVQNSNQRLCNLSPARVQLQIEWTFSLHKNKHQHIT